MTDSAEDTLKFQAPNGEAWVPHNVPENQQPFICIACLRWFATREEHAAHVWKKHGVVRRATQPIPNHLPISQSSSVSYVE